MPHDTEPLGEGQLPVKWEKQQTPEGRAYFVDHNTHTNTWVDPRRQSLSTADSTDTSTTAALSATSGGGGLPAGWELHHNPEGREYFVDHNTHTNTWTDPRHHTSSTTKPNGGSTTVVDATRAGRGKLPAGWEMKPLKSKPGVYFVDHNTKTTTWHDPRTLLSSL